MEVMITSFFSKNAKKLFAFLDCLEVSVFVLKNSPVENMNWRQVCLSATKR
jgi:hypothetical protein